MMSVGESGIPVESSFLGTPFPRPQYDDPSGMLSKREPFVPNEQAHPGYEAHLTPGERVLDAAIHARWEHWLEEDIAHDTFDRLIQEEVNSCLNPDDREMIETMAAGMEWRLFSAPGQELPDGLVLNEAGDLLFENPDYRPNSWAVTVHVERILSPVLDAYYKSYGDRNVTNRIFKGLQAVVKEGPLYQTLRALATNTPEDTETPLTEAQRAIRERQEEDAVRKAHGLGQNTDLHMHPNALQDFRRRTYRLDDETTRTKQLQSDDPRQRLLDFIIKKINATAVPGEFSGVVTHLENDPDSSRIYAVTDQGDRIKIIRRLSAVSNEVAREMNPGEGWLEHSRDVPSHTLLYDLAVSLVKSNDPELTALQHLDESTLPYSTEFVRDYLFVPRAKQLAYLYGLDVPIVAYDDSGPSGFYSWRKEPAKGSVNIVQQERMLEEMSQIDAFVDGPSQKDADGHLVMRVSSRREYPEFANNYDLSLHVPEESYDQYQQLNTAPLVPGYTLVAHGTAAKRAGMDGRKYYFVKDEFNPYDEAAFADIPSEKIQILAQHAARIGATQLAKLLESTETLTLDDLALMISRTSDYTFDGHYQLNGRPEDYDDDNFAALVNEHGRFQIQCTGAAAVLAHFVKDALPGSTTAFARGNIIGPRGVVSSARHAQLMVTANGRKYILDATPGLADRSHRVARRDFGVGSILLSINAFLARRKETKAFRSSKASVEVTEISSTVSMEAFDSEPAPEEHDKAEESTVSSTGKIREEIVAREIDTTTTHARHIIKAHFNLPVDSPDEDLYKRLTELKKDADPLRRVMKLVLQHEKGVEVGEDLEREATYLDNVANATPAVIRRLGIPEYDRQLITELGRIVKVLAATYD